jgi:uncharacterized membrane-anchored protein
VIALLHTGDVARARSEFDAMNEFVERKPNDLRVRLLEAHIGARERKTMEDGRSKTEQK